MDTDLPTTQALYMETLNKTPGFIASSVQGVNVNDVERFMDTCNGSKRIIFTGAGSSIPAAQLGAYSLQQQGKPAFFLPTGSVLGLASLQSTDVVVICSQGLNRADATLVINKVVTCHSKLIIITANRQSPLTKMAQQVVYFDPEKEKLFCRPAGVAANYAVVASLANQGVTAKSCVEAWQKGVESPLRSLDPTMRYVVLASDMMLPVSWNVALSLREGSGILANLYDIETYAHGNYVADIAHKPFSYLVVSASYDTVAARSVRRIQPFLSGTQVSVQTVEAPYYDVLQAGLYILGVFAKTVQELNAKNSYNMNRPNGKEENRYYHELASYDV